MSELEVIGVSRTGAGCAGATGPAVATADAVAFTLGSCDILACPTNGYLRRKTSTSRRTFYPVAMHILPTWYSILIVFPFSRTTKAIKKHSKYHWNRKIFPAIPRHFRVALGQGQQENSLHFFSQSQTEF